MKKPARWRSPMNCMTSWFMRFQVSVDPTKDRLWNWRRGRIWPTASTRTVCQPALQCHGDGQGGVSGPENVLHHAVGASSSNAQGEGPTRRVSGQPRRGQKPAAGLSGAKMLVRTSRRRIAAWRRARFAVLRDAAMPAILVESAI